VILFWVICAIMVVIALAFVLPPLLAADTSKPLDDQEANVSVYRDQLAELEADLRNGIIAEDQYQQDRDGIERRMLEDVATGETAPKRGITTADRQTAYAIAFAVPVIALAQIGRASCRERV